MRSTVLRVPRSEYRQELRDLKMARGRVMVVLTGLDNAVWLLTSAESREKTRTIASS
jgi:hypothetical protein